MPSHRVFLIRRERALTLTLSATLRSAIALTTGLTATQRQSHLDTPYELLMHALSTLKPHEAQWWSRAHAFTDAPLSPATWGLMKVAGKRLYAISSDDMDTRLHELMSSSFISLEVIDDASILEWLHVLCNNSPNNSPATLISPLIKATLSASVPSSIKGVAYNLSQWVHACNQILCNDKGGGEVEVGGRRWSGSRRVVGALALGPQYELLGYTLNTPDLSRTAHAEWLLLHELTLNDRWPTYGPVTLISSLKPCKMCAGAWITHAPAYGLNIYFLRDDPGPNGQNTAFDLDSHAWNEAMSARSFSGSVSQSRLILGSDEESAEECTPNPI